MENKPARLLVTLEKVLSEIRHLRVEEKKKRVRIKSNVITWPVHLCQLISDDGARTSVKH